MTGTGNMNEKRQQKRYHVQHSATLVFSDKRLPVRLLDVNMKGASFLVPPFEEVPDHFYLEFDRSPEPITFKGEKKDQIEMKAKNGVSLIRIGMSFTDTPEHAQAFFAELAKKIIRKDSPSSTPPANQKETPTQKLPDCGDDRLTAISPGNPSDDATAILLSSGEKNASSGSETNKEDGRQHKRVKFKMPLVLTCEGQKFHGQSLDVSEMGMGLLTTTDFPNVEELVLHCKSREDLVFRLNVAIRFRKPFQVGGKSFQKLGTKITSASPEFQKFLQENHITQRKTKSYNDEDHRRAESGHVLESCKYRYLSHLGTGGFAKVYLVEDVALHRKVAMKILLPNITVDKSMAKKFIKEAQIAAKFHHPNIALVFEVGEIFPNQYRELLDFPDDIIKEYEKSMVYFTMQYIEGRTLSDVIKKQKKLPALKVLSILRDVGNALVFAHREGVVHRDIKPDNIMMTFNDKILVTDFGIASVLKQGRSSDAAGQGMGEGQAQEKTKGFMGTPLYVSPEQILEAEVDGRTDLYSLGITGYELLTGVPPFKGKTWMETLAKQLHEDPVPPQSIDTSVPGNFNDFILQLIQKKKENRPANSSEFLMKLNRLEEHLLADRVVIDEFQEVSPEDFELVEKLFKQFTKALKTIGTYPESHEMVDIAVKNLLKLFEEAFESFERLDFEISSMHVSFQGSPVFSEDQKENGFCFNLFRDGVRNLIFFRGLPVGELQGFLTTVYNYINNSKTYEVDSVTLFFQLALKYIDFEYSDSFYEDPESQARMFRIQAEVFQEEKWSVPAMLKSAFPAEKLMVYWDNLQSAFESTRSDQYVERLKNLDLSKIRHEAIRICLLLVEKEHKIEVFENQYALMEEVIYSCVSENDLSSALFVIKSLGAWALNAPEDDFRKCAAQFVHLQERLSKQEFLEPLIEKYFIVSRSYGDSIMELCQALTPNLAVPILFTMFEKEQESWKLPFLAQCTVLAAGPITGTLNRLGLTLPDEKAAVFLKGYKFMHANASKTTLMKWFSHPGEETRQALAQIASQVNRTESQPILKRCAAERSLRYEETREFAWQFLTKHAPNILQSVVREFMSVEAFGDLSSKEKAVIFQMAGSSLAFSGGEKFLIEVVQEKGLLGSGSLSLADKKKAAEVLMNLGSEKGNAVLVKESKRILGNREFIQFLKQLCENVR